MPRHVTLAVVGAVLAGLAAGPSSLPPATADVGGEHLVASGVQVGGSLELYDYADATPVSAPADSPWDDGAYASTRSDLVPGALTLDHFGAGLPNLGEPWWDTAWRSRRCFDVDHTAAGASDLDGYQVRVVLDTADPIAAGTFDADAQDLRAARSDGGGGFVDLDLWVDPATLDTIATDVWVQVDEITAGATTDFCLYWNNPAPVASVSDQLAVMTTATPVPLYYTVSDAYGPGADEVRVAPYADGTVVTQDGGAPVGGDAGDVLTFTGNGPDTVVAATGPLAATGTGDGQDSLVPASFAGTAFVVPIERDGQRFSVRSPWATADVEVADGSTTVASASVAPGDGTVTLVADVTSTHAAVVRSTNGVPFLLTHRSDVGGDSVVVPPATTDDLLGVESQWAELGYGATGTATVDRSDGTEELVGGDPDSRDTFGPGAAGGAGPAVRVTALDVPGGAVQRDDGDGGESTAFWPEGALGDRYLVPVDVEHVVVACPVAGTQLSIGGGPAVTCAGAELAGGFIGHASDATGWSVGASALSVASVGGEPFWLAYDRAGGPGAGDESQVGGVLQGRQVAYPAPTVTPRAEEGSYVDGGRWDSAPVDTGTQGVYGLLDWTATTPAATTVRFQLASGPNQLASVLAPFVGPDGTAATWYTAGGTPAAYGHDFDRWVRIRAELTTTDPWVTPEVDAVTLDTDLAAFGEALDTPSTIPVTAPAGVPTAVWLARVRTAGANFDASTATIRAAGPPVVPGVDAATVAFARPDADQVVVAAESVTQPTGTPIAFDAATPHSVALSVTTSSAATLDITWSVLVGGTSPVIEHRFRLDLSG